MNAKACAPFVFAVSALPLFAACSTRESSGPAISPVLTSLCAPGEESFFEGIVHDADRTRMSTCVAPSDQDGRSVIAVRWLGANGPGSVSCIADACGGIIGLQDYVRYRRSDVTLVYVDGATTRQISESFEGDDPSAEPFHTITATAYPTGGEPTEPAFDVDQLSERFSLLGMARYIAISRWPDPALGRTPRQ